ncbi:glycosyl transferase, group 2 family protein [Legionella quinlivanii]|uniref:Glycosyl transferase, group 2 family protein n=1 Tax=Legionella quinlivanii TaxID=45073 RepID=A0A0W0Y1K4_9GAMM|nr:glycosyltransferase family 2 protein [Legionella quinlivanii]KTD50682.1 glycosyl transferase, group 2 family protein [Legionella quinlivanii]MCW8450227.1 glycosyltransferase family 2 protein [Legionella quinlivanii]SEG36170.1 dolichol-phosphate mannosyltransferase [Legionella quinlivanii DSM 21216]STY11623.1 glycosyl transferase, group 2 family protein [Legionella quinlivanii]
MKQPINLSVIIPVYNEEDNVEVLFHELVNVLEKDDYCFEVIFVDDGSNDETVSRLLKLAAEDERLQLVRHRVNCGQSAALVSGAKAARYEFLVTLDGDGQNDPNDIPALCGFIEDHKTVVLGNRKRRDDNLIRRISSRIGNGVRQTILRDSCPDTGCSLKLFPKSAFLNLPHFNHLHRYLPALFLRAGYRLVNVPVNHRPRRHGVSKYGVMNRLFVGIYDLVGVRWLLKRPCSPEVINNEL